MTLEHAMRQVIALDACPNFCTICGAESWHLQGTEMDTCRRGHHLPCPVESGATIGPATRERPGPRHGGISSMQDERIAQARALVAEGWTQKAIAEKFGVNQSAVSRWCNPKRDRTGLCACGCGTVVGVERRSWNVREFAPYHDRRGEGKDYEVRDCGFHTPCWVWLKARNGDGYGQLCRDGAFTSAHRYFYEQANGPVPDGLELDHRCVNPPCCNPDHLEPVTHSTNSRRRQDAKLSWGSARAIRASGLPSKVLAERYGISTSHVNSIRSGRRWQEAA